MSNGNVIDSKNNMNESEKFLRMFGGIYLAIGIFLLVVGAAIGIIFRVWMGGIIPILLGLVFGGIGGGILYVQHKHAVKRKEIARQGRRFTGKIYGYVEDHSGTMNGGFLMNTKVRYFDETGTEREAIIPTGFTKGSGEYPIGATIDIIVLNTSSTWVPGSVRYERIPGEALLMDDKPLDPQKVISIAVTCRNCGASFTAARGYANVCPYCGSAINVK